VKFGAKSESHSEK
jgi:kynureninase